MTAAPHTFDDAAPDTAPMLTIRVGQDSHRVEAADSPVVIGRAEPGSKGPKIAIPDGRVSREHLVVYVRSGAWFGVPKGRNGVFVDGRQLSEEFEIPEEGITTVLGHPNVGIQVHFSSLDPSLVYVGAQVAARRSELDISQRTLAANQIINAGTLIAFEKGRSWPRARTREKLEEALGWPPGRIESLRRQHAGELQRGAQTTAVAAASPADEGERTVMLGAGETTAVESRYMAETIAVALSNIRSQVSALPAVTDPGFQSAAAGLLADLARLESAASNASRGASGAQDIFRELGAVRRARRDLMLLAAASPHATIGQRVFAARHRAELTVEEAAAMVGISPHDVAAAESGTAVPETQAGALNRLLAALQ